VFILIFLCVVIGGSLALYSWRAAQIRSSISFKLMSREFALLLNNVILVVAAVSVLLGTLYPLFLDALGAGKISVGPPYFNSVFVPLTAPLAVVVGIGALSRWKQDQAQRLIKRLRIPLVLALVLGVLLPVVFAPDFHWQAAAGMILALWVVLATLVWIAERGRGGLLQGLMQTSRGGWGMVFGHLGIAVFIVGVTLTSIYSTEKDLSMEPGSTRELGGYAFTFQGVKQVNGPNCIAQRGSFDVSRDGQPVAHLEPEKRNYFTSEMPMTEAGIDDGLTRDLFVALGEPLGEQGAWSVRIYHKPFVRWIWLGGLLMALGGLLGASDGRYYRMRRRDLAAQPA
jgi:cytochrome c-type biogenesis protein CcmF